MKVIRGETEKEYILEFDDLQEYESFFENLENQGSFIISDTSLRLDANFRARVAGSPRSRIVRPKKIFMDDNSRLVVQLHQHEPVSVPKIEEEPTGFAGKDASPDTKIRSLTVTEKSLLAMKANLAERRVLMQDTNPKVQEFLLRNPRIKETEIAWIAKNPISAIPTLLSILQRKDWMSTDSIRQGILTNPKTPAHIILEKIPGLGAGDLIKMHQARALREDIRVSVQREMKKRGIRIPRD